MNGNRQQSNGRSNAKPPQSQAPDQPKAGLFVPRQYLPDTSDRSLEIRINSPDDAKSVIQNLPAIKQAYDAAGNLTSVEFCIADSVAREVESTLLGAVRWCRTYTKHIAPNPGNVLFVLPSYKDLSIAPSPSQTQAPISSGVSIPANTATQPHVKPQRPVRAEPARQ